MSAFPVHTSTGRGALSQATIETKKRRGRWWAPIDVGVDIVPDSQDGSGDELIFIPDSVSVVDVMTFIQESMAREKAVEEKTIKASKHDAMLKRRYQLLPPLEPEICMYLLSMSKRDIVGELKPVKESAAQVMEHYELGVDIGGHSQAEDDTLYDELLLDNESQPIVSLFSLTRSGSMFRSGMPSPLASTAGTFRSGSPPPAGRSTSSSSKPGGLLRSNAMTPQQVEAPGDEMRR